MANIDTQVNLAVIAEERAVWDVDGQKVSGIVADRVLKRKFTDIDIRELSSLAEHLRRRTSVRNPDNGQKYYSVTNPMVNGIEVPGLWRGVLVETIEDSETNGTIIQTLNYGWAQSIDYSETRLLDGQKLRGDENYLTVQWTGLDATKLNAMALTLNASTYNLATWTSINKEAYTGTWHNIKVVPSLAQDGSGIITMFLGQPEFTLTAYADALTPRAKDITYYFQVPKDEAQAIITAAKVEGATCNCSYANASGLVDIIVYTRNATSITFTDVVTAWDCRYKEYSSYYFNLTKTAAEALVLTEPPAGWTYQYRPQLNGDGTWDVVVVKRQSQYRDIPFQTSEITGLDHTETRQQLGLTSETPEPMVQADGEVKTQHVEVRDDCSKDVITNKKTADDASVNEYIAHMSEGLTEYRSEEYHDPNPPNIMKFKDSGGTERTITLDANGNPTYGGNNVEITILSHDLDDYLTHNYKKSRIVRTFPFTGEVTWDIYGGIEMVTTQVYDATIGRYWNNHTYVYWLKYTHTLKYFKTAAEAAAYIPAVATETGPGGWTFNYNEGSNIMKTGEFEWLCHKVVMTKTLLTTYDYEQPTS